MISKKRCSEKFWRSEFSTAKQSHKREEFIDGSEVYFDPTATKSSTNDDINIEQDLLNRRVQSALRKIMQTRIFMVFWTRMESLHKEIAANPMRPISVRIKEAKKTAEFRFRLRWLPALVLVQIADNRIAVWLKFDGRYLRRDESRAAYLKKLQSCESLARLNMEDLTTDPILIQHRRYFDISPEAIMARESDLIEKIVDFLEQFNHEIIDA